MMTVFENKYIRDTAQTVMVESDFFALPVAEVVSEVCAFQKAKQRGSEMESLGYMRISTRKDSQTFESQRVALEAAGVTRFFEDRITGAINPTNRNGWNELMEYVREGDSITVWRLDRLGRSLPGVVSTTETLDQRGIRLVSLTEGFDTGTPLGRLTVGILASIAAWQREVIVENVNAGLDAARSRGVKLGRPKVLDDDRTHDLALAMLHRGDRSAASVAERFGVSRATAYRALSTKTP